ncbi:MAG: DUF1501 domain-containing protein [Gemmataceae bacterium]
MLHRRQLLRASAASLFGLALPQLAAGRERAKAKAVIFLHQFGGPSQFETFDMKPKMPEEIRGIFAAVPSKLPGVPVNELLPRTAQVMDKVCLVRSMTHTMKNHNSAAYYSLTGRVPPLDDIRLRDSLDLFPAYGSVVDKLAPNTNGMPTFVAFPHRMSDGSVTPGQHASFLGKAYNPLFFTQDPNSASFGLPELQLPGDLSLERLENRREILKLIDQQSGLLEHSAAAKGIDETYQKAIAMLTSPKVKQAFDLSKEPAKLRDEYGRTTYGQSCLLARRLVESGVKFVNVYLSQSIGGSGPPGGWDTHGFRGVPMNPVLKNYLLPLADQTLPALLNDLDARGLLDSTLVLWVGEFGRSPRINKEAGRDHWPQCYTALLAGGGVKRGHVHGASDKTGAYPASDPVKPDDLAATVYALLGIDPNSEVRDTFGRPLAIAAGSPVMGVMA